MLNAFGIYMYTQLHAHSGNTHVSVVPILVDSSIVLSRLFKDRYILKIKMKITYRDLDTGYISNI